MQARTALRFAAFGLIICLTATARPVSAASSLHVADGSWLSRTLVAREAALSRAYNTCNLHALHASLFAGTTIETPDGSRIDPLREVRDRICGHLRRQVLPGSLSVHAVGNDSALVTGRQRFCAIGASPCAGQVSTFAQLWTLYRGHWRLGWMRRSTDSMGQAGSGATASGAPDAKNTNVKAAQQDKERGAR